MLDEATYMEIGQAYVAHANRLKYDVSYIVVCADSILR